MTPRTSRQGSIFRAPPGLRAAGSAAFAGFSLHVLARTPSTQDLVLAAAARGAPEGYCCVAQEQTAGRGRLGRRWLAPPGTALLMSVLLRPRADRQGGVTLAAGLAVADALETGSGVSAQLKWPNDILVDGMKLGGVLAEVESDAVVLGVGLNLRVDGVPDVSAVASLHRLVDPAPRWDQLLTVLLPALATRLAQLELSGVPGLRPDWTARAAGLGAPARVSGPAGRVEGIATGIDDDGALLVAGPGGVTRVVAGDVLLLPPG